MKIGNLEIRGDLVLAPMAGVTDLAFRTICAELGATVTVTEMVSSRALIYQGPVLSGQKEPVAAAQDAHRRLRRADLRQ